VFHVSEINEALSALVRRRERVAVLLSMAMIAIYFGFVLLIAFAKPAMGRPLMPGLSVGIVLGVLVIVLTWITTLLYVRWANQHMDAEIERLKNMEGGL
jgi:uncharacterized membrane protein (DUF485 family)